MPWQSHVWQDQCFASETWTQAAFIGTSLVCARDLWNSMLSVVRAHNEQNCFLTNPSHCSTSKRHSKIYLQHSVGESTQTLEKLERKVVPRLNVQCFCLGNDTSRARERYHRTCAQWFYCFHAPKTQNGQPFSSVAAVSIDCLGHLRRLHHRWRSSNFEHPKHGRPKTNHLLAVLTESMWNL